jgi:HAD superfamily phosphatase (TIGR01668 family)
MAILTPTYYLKDVFCITPDGMRECGYKALLLDADNTILPRSTDKVDPSVIAWAHGLVDEGFEVMILSNSWHDRVENLARQADLPLQRNAWKPLPQGFIAAQKRLSAKKSETLVVGDQLFTDVLGSKLWGWDVAKVIPCDEYDLPHTLLLRKFDRPLMGKVEPADRLGIRLTGRRRRRG